jgi:hypothetical protein
MAETPLAEGKELIAAQLVGLAEDLANHQKRGELEQAKQTANTLIELIRQALTMKDAEISQIISYIYPLLPPEVIQTKFNPFYNSDDINTRYQSLSIATNVLEPDIVDNILKKIPKSDIRKDFRYAELNKITQFRRLNITKGLQYQKREPLTKDLNSVTTVIHGTWATNDDWWKPGQRFVDEVDKIVGDVYKERDFFFWSGENDDEQRRKAAQDLKTWVNQRLVPKGKLQLICHSHGGNVALIASELGLQINNLILLGTPIRTDYTPNMENIKKVYNIYVPWDSIQSAGAFERRRGEGRTLADTERILNIAVCDKIGGILESHSALHDWNVWNNHGFGKLLVK